MKKKEKNNFTLQMMQLQYVIKSLQIFQSVILTYGASNNSYEIEFINLFSLFKVREVVKANARSNNPENKVIKKIGIHVLFNA